MATAAMAGAAGAAVVLYYSGWGNPWGGGGQAQEQNGNGESDSLLSGSHRRLNVNASRPPSTWFEALATISETLRFTYSETLGKWPIGDLAFGINYLLRRQVCVPSSCTVTGITAQISLVSSDSECCILIWDT